MKFSEFLRLYRKSNSLTQENLASSTGFTKAYISHLETEKKTPGMEFIKTFSQVYNIPAILFASNELMQANNEEEKKLKNKIDFLLDDLKSYYLTE